MQSQRGLVAGRRYLIQLCIGLAIAVRTGPVVVTRHRRKEVEGEERDERKTSRRRRADWEKGAGADDGARKRDGKEGEAEARGGRTKKGMRVIQSS
jgi:hypothetical protein